ncbi:hypothetical protein E4V51_31735 [Paenibacillus sp. 28ISP30-2]|nr:hypothetical protein [Paenibacillus sp. 28ISP30-2]
MPQQNEHRVARRVELRRRSAASEDLGNGFYSFKWTNQEIGQNETVIFFLSAEGFKVINAGYAVGRQDPAYSMESDPNTKEQWVMSVINPSAQRYIHLYLIAKS